MYGGADQGAYSQTKQDKANELHAIGLASIQ